MTAARPAFARLRQWSRTVVLVVAAAAVVAELAAALGVIGDYARFGWRAASAPNPLVRDADLDPLAQYAPTAALVRAAQTIPPGSTYAIVVGDDPPVELPGDIRSAFRFWLAGRRYTTDVHDADWVVAYHRSSEHLGVRVGREIGLVPAVNVVEVKR